ncbi:MAG: type I-MYXAN CRISPR-associated endonuclease Cas1 [Myxococcota bacterium]
MEDSHRPLLSAMALHALAYCERLFYLEEVERIRIADDRVYAGRRLHESLEEDGEWSQHVLESAELGLRGKVDALRRRDGRLIPYEHKRGLPLHQEEGPSAWPSDRLQLGAYAVLLEEALQEEIPEGRVRYHAANTLVKLPIDAKLREEVRAAVHRAEELRCRTERPAITDNERLCVRCSLAPVCLPEETRKSQDPKREVTRLFPGDDDRQPLHVLGHGTRVGRRGYELKLEPLEGDITTEPIRRIRSVTLHGYSSMSAQALDLCARQGVAVHWFRPGGQYVGSFSGEDAAVQRRIRQYEALRQTGLRVRLARLLVASKAEQQLRFVLRSSRGRDRTSLGLDDSIKQMRTGISSISRATDTETLLGLEGWVAKAYFSALPKLVVERVPFEMHPKGRSRRPPKDPFNALLSFGYGMLLREVVQSIRSVGLDGAFGFYHQPRSSAPPLALDLIELFRVTCVDMPVLAAVNRGHFDLEKHFEQAGEQFWLSKDGRRKAIALFEQRLADRWRHPVLEYSLSYRRAIELEVRLLEKEWSGEAGLFARMRLR